MLRRQTEPGIHVVHTNDGTGICGVCGNGLWPEQGPCEHKREAAQSSLGPWEPETDTEYDQRIYEEIYGGETP